jgi:hypothetical protein
LPWPGWLVIGPLQVERAQAEASRAVDQTAAIEAERARPANRGGVGQGFTHR